MAFWLKARSLLASCLKVYHSQGYTVESYLDKRRSYSPVTTRIKEFLKFTIQERFEPRALLMSNLDEISTKLMLHCVFSIDPEGCKKPPKEVGQLISDCRHANYLHTRGQWHEISDHIKLIKPRKAL